MPGEAHRTPYVTSEHYAAWRKSSHHAVAVCNDCHAPHNLVGKYVIKARNGFWHSFYFTTGGYPDPLRITPRNHQVTEGACRYCHEAITEAIEHGAGYGGEGGEEGFLCTRRPPPAQLVSPGEAPGGERGRGGETARDRSGATNAAPGRSSSAVR
jgi:cytochrome c nitrite reductase small subunit